MREKRISVINSRKKEFIVAVKYVEQLVGLWRYTFSPIFSDPSQPLLLLPLLLLDVVCAIPSLPFEL